MKINQFADILNETADYETQLNMARELSYKGFDQLADATFILGYTYAQDIINQDAESLEAMRANWQLTKYAYELDRIELAREAGESVVKQYGNPAATFDDIQIYNKALTTDEILIKYENGTTQSL